MPVSRPFCSRVQDFFEAVCGPSLPVRHYLLPTNSLIPREKPASLMQSGFCLR